MFGGKPRRTQLTKTLGVTLNLKAARHPHASWLRGGGTGPNQPGRLARSDGWLFEKRERRMDVPLAARR